MYWRQWHDFKRTSTQKDIHRKKAVFMQTERYTTNDAIILWISNSNMLFGCKDDIALVRLNLNGYIFRGWGIVNYFHFKCSEGVWLASGFSI